MPLLSFIHSLIYTRMGKILFYVFTDIVDIIVFTITITSKKNGHNITLRGERFRLWCFLSLSEGGGFVFILSSKFLSNSSTMKNSNNFVFGNHVVLTV